MSSERPTLKITDILRRHGAAFRAAHIGYLSLGQLKVMSAIKACRTVALGGHVEGCQNCGHRRIAYNSCRNRHCPKCQAAAARDWLEAREADLLPVGYFHVVFSLPAEIADITIQNKAAVYDLLFRAASHDDAAHGRVPSLRLARQWPSSRQSCPRPRTFRSAATAARI